MKVGAYLGNQAHAPGNSRTALISAYTCGASVLHFATRLTADQRVVLAQEDDVAAATGAEGQIGAMTLAALRQLDFSHSFTPRGSASGDFNYFDPAVEGRRFALDALDEIVSELPRDVDWLIEIRPEDAVDTVAELLRSRGALSRSVLAFDTTAAAARIKTRFPKVRTALVLPAEQPLPDSAPPCCDVLVVAAERFWRDGGWTADAQQFCQRQGDDYFALGAHLATPATGEAGLLAAAGSAEWVWGVCLGSMFDFADLRPTYPHVAESFAGTTVDRTRFALGYAKANGFATVTWDDGIHVDIAPYTGNLPGSSGDAIERRLSRIEWDLIDVARQWPFYSGGGVGLVAGIADDFAAEVSYRVKEVGQATTLEMAVLNVDPGAHRGAPPTSFRDKDSFYDPHGAPPYVGVEHDEDDGFRINWNLASEYDSNQYGRPVGDGRTARGADLRLERRGAYFSAYYRKPVDASGSVLHPRDWVCVGVARNDTLNRTLYLRCVGKRWRQEKADDPSQYEPIIANKISFQNLRVTCFPPVDGE
jgi:hypothetical protein